MKKLLGGLGLCLALGSVQPLSAQDPFGVPDYVPIQTGPAFSEFPAAETEPETPIIQNTPIAQAKKKPYNEGSNKSRAQNAYVRSTKTPAQEFIYKRAVFEARQRTARMEYRKWRGESLLRPSNREDRSGWHEYTVPLWHSSHYEARIHRPGLAVEPF